MLVPIAVYSGVSMKPTHLTKAVKFYQWDSSDRDFVAAPITGVSVSPTFVAPLTLMKTFVPYVSVKSTSGAKVFLDVSTRNTCFERTIILQVSVPPTLYTKVLVDNGTAHL